MKRKAADCGATILLSSGVTEKARCRTSSRAGSHDHVQLFHIKAAAIKWWEGLLSFLGIKNTKFSSKEQRYQHVLSADATTVSSLQINIQPTESWHELTVYSIDTQWTFQMHLLFSQHNKGWGKMPQVVNNLPVDFYKAAVCVQYRNVLIYPMFSKNYTESPWQTTYPSKHLL